MMTTGTPTNVDGLVSSWAALSNIQRAEALANLHGKTSLRDLAKRLGRNESSLRNLVEAGKAPLAYFAISDPVTRDRALGLALNKQITGESAIAPK